MTEFSYLEEEKTKKIYYFFELGFGFGAAGFEIGLIKGGQPKGIL
jgi:hypothetical protein